MQPLWKTAWRFLTKLELPYDTAIPLLGQSYNVTWYMHPLFIIALSTIAKTWKRPRCPLAGEWIKKWIKKMWYLGTMEYRLALRKKGAMSFAATWIHLEIIVLSEVSQIKTNTLWYNLYVESKIQHKWNRSQLTDIVNRSVAAKWEGIRSLGLADTNYYTH